MNSLWIVLLLIIVAIIWLITRKRNKEPEESIEELLIRLKKERVDKILQAKNYLFFDLETNGLPKRKNAESWQVELWPRVVQLAWVVKSSSGKTLEEKSYIVKPNRWRIPKDAREVHGISYQQAKEEGVGIDEVLAAFSEASAKCDAAIAHYLEFREGTLAAEFFRKELACPLDSIDCVDINDFTNDISMRAYSQSLNSLYQSTIKDDWQTKNNALDDALALSRIFFSLIEKSSSVVEKP